MKSSRTILIDLKKVIRNQYPTHVTPTQQSIYFEKLIAEVFSYIFYVPFYTLDIDDPEIPYRVTWQGDGKSFSKAQQGCPDTIAYCYGFYLIIEATRKTGSNQWTQEFSQCIRHWENFCTQNRIQQKDVFVVIVCSKIHEDTYRSVKANPEKECKIVLIETSHLASILQTSILAFTLGHLELRNLFNRIYKCIRDSSLGSISISIKNTVETWQKEVLKLERNVFLGIKSYEVMRKIGRSAVAVSEILRSLQGHPYVTQYLNIVGEKLTADNIVDSLIQQSLAYSLVSTIQDDEPLLEPVLSVDFASRGFRIIDAVEKIK